jgi:hypothetical protein
MNCVIRVGDCDIMEQRWNEIWKKFLLVGLDAALCTPLKVC